MPRADTGEPGDWRPSTAVIVDDERAAIVQKRFKLLDEVRLAW